MAKKGKEPKVRRYRVGQRSYRNGVVYEKGSVVVIGEDDPDQQPSRHWTPLDEKELAASRDSDEPDGEPEGPDVRINDADAL